MGQVGTAFSSLPSVLFFLKPQEEGSGELETRKAARSQQQARRHAALCSPDSSSLDSVQIILGSTAAEMGSTEVPMPVQTPASPTVSEGSAAATDSKPKKKICCACPDTKRLRDECMVEHGESACTKWIEAHKKCLRAEGFKV